MRYHCQVIQVPQLMYSKGNWRSSFKHGANYWGLGLEPPLANATGGGLATPENLSERTLFVLTESQKPRSWRSNDITLALLFIGRLTEEGVG